MNSSELTPIHCYRSQVTPFLAKHDELLIGLSRLVKTAQSTQQVTSFRYDNRDHSFDRRIASGSQSLETFLRLAQNFEAGLGCSRYSQQSTESQTGERNIIVSTRVSRLAFLNTALEQISRGAAGSPRVALLLEPVDTGYHREVTGMTPLA